jgi:hypothetical protein
MENLFWGNGRGVQGRERFFRFEVIKFSGIICFGVSSGKIGKIVAGGLGWGFGVWWLVVRVGAGVKGRGTLRVW